MVSEQRAWAQDGVNLANPAAIPVAIGTFYGQPFEGKGGQLVVWYSLLVEVAEQRSLQGQEKTLNKAWLQVTSGRPNILCSSKLKGHQHTQDLPRAGSLCLREAQP